MEQNKEQWLPSVLELPDDDFEFLCYFDSCYNVGGHIFALIRKLQPLWRVDLKINGEDLYWAARSVPRREADPLLERCLRQRCSGSDLIKFLP